MKTKIRCSFFMAMVMFFVFPVFGVVNAASVSFETAQVVAENWMKRVGQNKMVSEGIVLQSENEQIGYLFNFSNGGFVVVPTDDLFEPIKAWSKEGSFSGDPLRTMDLETLVKKSFHKQKRFLSDEKVSQSRRALTSHKGWRMLLKSGELRENQESSQMVGPLLTTKWNQFEPFNNYCPIYSGSGQQSVTGCSVTALAQIMNYWEWPETGIGSKCYYDEFVQECGCGTAQTLCADFGSTTYDWANMVDSYLYADDNSPEEIDAVARLMSDLGIFMEVCYSSSGTYGPSIRLEDEFPIYYGYSDEIKNTVTNRDDFFPVVKEQIDKFYPVFFGSDGHAYVADGYLIDLGMDQIHFNFGWGGFSDGWYTSDGLDSFWDHPKTDGPDCVFMFTDIHPDFTLTNRPPPAPVLTVTTSGINVNCSWQPVAGAAGYLFSFAPFPFTGTSSIVTVDMGAQTSLFAELWVGASYYVAIQAYNNFGGSEYSNIELFEIY